MTMDAEARALLDAKIALEAELVRPISIVSLEYIDACRENGGRQLPTFTRIQHAERMEAVLLRHYCRVSMVVTNRRPPRDPSPAEAALSLRHQESMILRSRREAQRILDSIDREFAREMARAMPSPATVDDGTGQKDDDLTSQSATSSDDMEFKAKVSGVSAGMVGQFSSRLAAIANANTNAVAEEARQANLIDELEEGDERLVQVWNSLLDGRERMSHGDAHGQRRPIDEPFEVGGALLRFPGDSGLGAPISETINCRCYLRTIAVKPDGAERTIHQGTSAPARRQRRRGDRAIGPTRNPPVKPGTSDRVGERMPATPTSTVTLNGTTRATVVLGNGSLATLRQVTPNTIVVRVGRTTIARASTMGGSVTSIQVNPAWSASGVEGLIARSVAHSAARRN